MARQKLSMLTTRDHRSHQLDVLGVGQSVGQRPLVPGAGQPARVVDDAVDGVHCRIGQRVEIARIGVVRAGQGMRGEGRPQAAAVRAAGSVPRLARDRDALRPAPVRAGRRETPPVARVGGREIAADAERFVSNLHAPDSSPGPVRVTTSCTSLHAHESKRLRSRGRGRYDGSAVAEKCGHGQPAAIRAARVREPWQRVNGSSRTRRPVTVVHHGPRLRLVRLPPSAPTEYGCSDG